MRRQTPIVEPCGDILCRKCQWYLARLIDGVFCTGGVRVYGKLKYFCGRCGSPYIYVEPPVNMGDVPEVHNRETLHGLGEHKRKRQPRRGGTPENEKGV
jgi:hypothetical protein